MDQQTTAHEPHRFRIGTFEATVVSDGVIPITDAIVASTPPRQEIDRVLGGAGIEGDEVPPDVNVLALDTGDDGLVLVDAGAGAAVPFPGGGRLLAALAAAGIRPGDVGTVVLTHAHADHIGGLMDGNGDAAFPNARYLISKREWEFWSSEPPLLELAVAEEFRGWLRSTPNAILAPLKDRLELFEFGDEVLPRVTALEASGHTPGHAALEIRSEGERLLHLADAAIHHEIHLRHTDWFGFGDNWPARTVPTRRELLGRAVSGGVLTMAYHFPFPGIGHVHEDGEGGGEGGGFVWDPIG